MDEENKHALAGKRGAEEYRKRQELGIAKPRGFAAMPPEKRREAGRQGGLAKKGKKHGQEE